MKLKSDNRKIYAILGLGFTMIICCLVSFWTLNEQTRLVWSFFFGFSGLLFLFLGLLSRNRYSLTDEVLTLSSILKIGTKKIPLNDIVRVKSINKEFPITANLNNPLWLLLWDKKFKRITKLEIFGENKLLGRIDGHYLDDNEYARLIKKLKRHSQRQAPPGKEFTIHKA